MKKMATWNCRCEHYRPGGGREYIERVSLNQGVAQSHRAIYFRDIVTRNHMPGIANPANLRAEKQGIA